jgi:tetratricopeptide (TPR) repeat protein
LPSSGVAPLTDEATLDAIDGQASVLMKRGLALMRESHPDRLSAALDCFDRARALRRSLPWDNVARYAYGLAACWLNRGEALLLLRDQPRLAEALSAFDESLVLLERLPLAEEARYPRRLALARHNRALVLQALGRPGEAQIDLRRALATLEDSRSDAVADRALLLAVVWTNLSNLHAAEECAAGDLLAVDAARRVLALVRAVEADVADAAEMGLKARHVLCRVSARRLSQGEASGTTAPDDVHDATDLADDALTLVEHWERNGVTRFRELAIDLFRFGARVYHRYQPQFLSEFFAEHLDPRRSAREYVSTVEAAVRR